MLGFIVSGILNVNNVITHRNQNFNTAYLGLLKTSMESLFMQHAQHLTKTHKGVM